MLVQIPLTGAFITRNTRSIECVHPSIYRKLMSALSRIDKLFARISGDEVSYKASSTVSTIPIS
jgi:hypothetical protein